MPKQPQPETERSTWQGNLLGRPGARSIAHQEEMFPEALGRKPKPKAIDPDQLDLFTEDGPDLTT